MERRYKFVQAVYLPQYVPSFSSFRERMSIVILNITTKKYGVIKSIQVKVYRELGTCYTPSDSDLNLQIEGGCNSKRGGVR